MLYTGLGDAVALYPVYTLLFGDAGLSTGQISTLLVFWSVTALLLEVPSGALADRVSRRALLAIGAGLRGVGFGLWVLVPSYPIFLLGFLLWSVQSALASGTLQALVYEGLRDHGAPSGTYDRLIGRAATAEMTAGLLATLGAAPLLAWGGYQLVGLVSVAACAAQVWVASTWPRDGRHPPAGAGGATGLRAGFAAYLATLRDGLREVWRHRALRRPVLAAGLLPGLMGFDEYLPLLARDLGAGRVWIPVLVAVPSLAMAVAGLVSGTRLAGRPAMGLLLAALVIGAGAAHGSVPGFVAIGLGLGAFHLARLTLEAAVQHAVTGDARATVTSVSGLLGEVSAMSVFLGVGVGAEYASVGAAVVVNAAAIGVAALLVPLAVRRPPYR